jgi:hypothetical protein
MVHDSMQLEKQEVITLEIGHILSHTGFYVPHESYLFVSGVMSILGLYLIEIQIIG